MHLLPAVSVAALYETVDRRGRHFARTDRDLSVCILFIYEFNQLFNAYKDAAGIWHRDRFRTLTTAGVNLVLNLLLVKPMGLYGVILSTVVATVIVGMPWLIHNLFTTLFDGEDRQSYLGTLVFYGSVTF